MRDCSLDSSKKVRRAGRIARPSHWMSSVPGLYRLDWFFLVLPGGSGFVPGPAFCCTQHYTGTRRGGKVTAGIRGAAAQQTGANSAILIGKQGEKRGHEGSI